MKKMLTLIMFVFFTTNLMGCMVRFVEPGAYIPAQAVYEEVPPHCRPCGNGQICCTQGTSYHQNQGTFTPWIGNNDNHRNKERYRR